MLQTAWLSFAGRTAEGDPSSSSGRLLGKVLVGSWRAWRAGGLLRIVWRVAGRAAEDL